MVTADFIPLERIERSILLVRGQRVLLDRDLAALYQVPTKVLNQAVKRNLRRFPDDFMFQLNQQEADALLRSQNVTSSATDAKTASHGGRRYLPNAFTEQGVAMLSSVLHSETAIGVNIAIMRAFVRLREIICSHQELAGKLAELEKKYDGQFKAVFQAIRHLMAPPPADDEKKRRIGF